MVSTLTMLLLRERPTRTLSCETDEVVSMLMPGTLRVGDERIALMAGGERGGRGRARGGDDGSEQREVVRLVAFSRAVVSG